MPSRARRPRQRLNTKIRLLFTTEEKDALETPRALVDGPRVYRGDGHRDRDIGGTG
jgi:hypothetical protein